MTEGKFDKFLKKLKARLDFPKTITPSSVQGRAEPKGSNFVTKYKIFWKISLYYYFQGGRLSKLSIKSLTRLTKRVGLVTQRDWHSHK